MKLTHPRFRRHLHAEVVAGEGVLLVADGCAARLNGRLFERLAPLLDGSLETEVVVDRLAAHASRPEVLYALHLLQQRGYVEESDTTLPETDAAYWGAQNLDAATVATRLATTTVSVASVGDVEAEPLRSLLEEAGVRLIPEGGDLRVVLTDDYVHDELAATNRRALSGQRPWMLAKPVGAQVWIGPVLRPLATGCWRCLSTRLRDNRWVQTTLPHGATAASRAAANGLIAAQITGWIACGGTSDLDGRILSVDVASGRTRTHVLVRRPCCPDCGEPDSLRERPLEAIVVRSCHKRFTADGGHRTCAPETTLDRFGHHLSEITGLGDALRRSDVDGGQGVVNVYLADDDRAVRDWPRGVRTRSASSGKGVTDSQARASALCEAIERYSGVYQGCERRVRARLSDLDDAAVDPREVMQFSERQYRDRDRWNARRSRFGTVPVRFDEAEEIDWSPLWSLTREAVRYLPTDLCYYAAPTEPERAYFRACSNGNAAGNTLEEAMLQGFLELTERDAIGIWWYNRVARPPVALDGFGDAYPERLRTFLAARGRDLWGLDLSNDLGIPVVGAFSHQVSGPRPRIVMGFGAHLEPRLALLRALTELGQMLAWVLPADRGDGRGRRTTDFETHRWLEEATLENQPHLVALQDVRPRTASDFPVVVSDDLHDDVLHCRQLVEAMGHEMLVLDQTRPEIGLPVVKVVVPGLRHCHARFAPGRLYEVPVNLGWLAAPLREEQLNPWPMVL
jgi:ribosomal protein S12 methylthiotransferase accessory factor